jgi:hypothetical protein
MDISTDKGYWLLKSYAARAVRLRFGGKIVGEQAACDAVITEVDRDLQLAVVELIDADSDRTWFRPVPLRGATFHLAMLGDPEFAAWVNTPFHLVLVLRYPDETSLFFAEAVRVQ